jgi:phage baseplate assembly protein W
MARDAHLLTDFRLKASQKDFRLLYQVADRRRPGGGGQGSVPDFETIDGRTNLGQAIMMRLLTPRGELTALGHPQYGSRLYELVGEINTETTRSLAKLFILESLSFEPRIEKVVELTILPTIGQRSSVDVTLAVLPIGQIETVIIGPFRLELG